MTFRRLHIIIIKSVCVHEKTRQNQAEGDKLKSPISLKLGTNVGFGE